MEEKRLLDRLWDTYGMTHQALYSYKLRFAFQGECGCLAPLNGRVFQVEDIPFLPFFYSLPKEGR